MRRATTVALKVVQTILCVSFLASYACAQERAVTERVTSRFLQGERTVRLYLPPSYAKESQRRFPVLYLHDGQNVFSSAGTNIAFGWGNWQLDLTGDELCRAGKMQEIIMVAVDNSPARFAEYGGLVRAVSSNTPTAFENYSEFLIHELKPRIDAQYRTRPDPANTGLMGSSMGGICSVVMAWQHPEIFGRAASLSGAFQVDTNFLERVLRPYDGKPKPIRYYLDSGVADFMGGDDGRKRTEAVATELRRIGWGNQLEYYVDARPLNLAELEKSGLRKDKWAEAQTSQHNEFYWRLRAWRALTFLFPPATATIKSDS
jgi:enterochelin esterase-like enzyme